MAMLAEKREKKCIRTFMLKSKPLTSDSCKVGQRLLEKMGWTPGKGLGVKEDGSPDPLRIKFKCDIKGLGFKENEKDALSCQEGFNDLLASLSQHNNSSHASHTNDEKDKALNSLEMVSKKSRARVHYQKFTRGKDLSQASSKDLASILGMSTEKVPEVITNKVQTSPLPSSLVHEVDGSSKRKRDKCFSSASAITEDADFNMESESINHKKKKKKKKLDCHNYEPSTFNNEKDTIDANSSPSGRRKSVTWGDVEVSYVSKYISDMIDTSSESFKEDDAAPTMLPENVSGVKTPTDEQSNKKKKKREVNNTDEGDNAILSNIDSKKLMSSENTCAGSGNPRDVSVSCLGERKKDKKKKKLRTNLEDVSDCKIFDSSSEISLKKQIPEDDGTDPIVMKKKQMKKKKQKEDNCGDNSGKAVETLDKGAVKSFSSEGTLLHSECLNGLLSKSKRKKRNSEEMNSSVITLSTEERASDFCRYSPEVMMNGIHNTNQNNVSSIKIKKKDKKKKKNQRNFPRFVD